MQKPDNGAKARIPLAVATQQAPASRVDNYEAGEPVVFVTDLQLSLDFLMELKDLQKGPWEVESPRSSSLGGEV